MDKLVVKPGKRYVKIASMFFIYAIVMFVLIMILYAPSHALHLSCFRRWNKKFEGKR